jgi:hypothetical protein
MSATIITFDKLAYIDRLREAGFDERQARAHAEALDAALRETVATKTDIDFLRAEIRADFANLKTALARWLFGAVLAIAGIIFAFEKLLR